LVLRYAARKHVFPDALNSNGLMEISQSTVGYQKHHHKFRASVAWSSATRLVTQPKIPSAPSTSWLSLS